MEVIISKLGFKKIVIDDNCDFGMFYTCAENLEKILNIEYTKQIDDYDSLYWAFSYMNSMFMLSYNTSLGISIYPENGKDASEENYVILEKIHEIIKDKNITYPASTSL